MTRHRHASDPVAPRAAPPPPRSRRRSTTFARLLGALGMITLTMLLFWLLTDDGFRVTDATVRLEGLRHADEAEVRARLVDIERGPNVFRVRAGDIVQDVSELTEVDAATASVTLPADVSVRLDERDPAFIWSDVSQTWLVDEAGMLFAPADSAAADDLGSTPDVPADAEARAELPLVLDRRRPEEPLIEGSYLPATDALVMRQLLALTPELLGSGAQDLRLRVDEVDGYVLTSYDGTWRAVFGHYYPTIQPTTDIPRQVQCLRWLLASREARLSYVRLALSDETCGTFAMLDDKAAGKADDKPSRDD